MPVLPRATSNPAWCMPAASIASTAVPLRPWAANDESPAAIALLERGSTRTL